ncbi:hypothetical protein [Desulfovibrio sp. Huiquan2017]|uniref:hypothetical protein n=1 Tax=Desulfovibrio sp. Huiquan2017 TaxID=2816861 RepID=UPI001A918538|nr:hypothetical protein [Desulfovibrio sp. Huiquan2017]
MHFDFHNQQHQEDDSNRKNDQKQYWCHNILIYLCREHSKVPMRRLCIRPAFPVPTIFISLHSIMIIFNTPETLDAVYRTRPFSGDEYGNKKSPFFRSFGPSPRFQIWRTMTRIVLPTGPVFFHRRDNGGREFPSGVGLGIMTCPRGREPRQSSLPPDWQAV